MRSAREASLDEDRSPEPEAGQASADAGLAGLFKVLADPTRLRILASLAGGERNVTALCGATGQPQPMVSHHLGILHAGKLVRRRRAGKEVFYSLAGEVSPSGLTFTVEAVSVRITLGQATDKPK